MTFKVTGTLVILLPMFISCATNEQETADLRFQQQLDSIASVSIDSAYKIIHAQCDTNMKYRLPVLVDSIVKADTTRL
jgi:hypothetical protein